MKRLGLTAVTAGAIMASGFALAPAAIAAPSAPAAPQLVPACSSAPAGSYRCFAVGVASSNGKVQGTPQPNAAGFTPSDVQAAYGLTGLHSNGRTVAIVDAYAYPQLESDLATYRSHFGLPACTTASGCLKIVGQNGGAPPSQSDSGWDIEQALDVDAVSAACPDCKILVVQANSPSFANLGTAVNTAAAATGVKAVSNSYGTSASTANLSYYNHPGVAITASTGDSGHTNQGSYPANDTHVVAVGGTSVTRNGSSYSESAWSGAGSGCGVAGNKRPAWQSSSVTTCTTKAAADVSAAADPSLGGLTIYATPAGGYAQYGGTSESSPIIAAVFALSGRTGGYPAKRLWTVGNSNNLHDVTSGSNGSCGVPVCTARAGWDGPTGLGTPKGVAAF